MKHLIFAACAATAGLLYAANPFLPLWEFIPDGEPYVFDDPDKPGEKRVYVYGSHDNLRDKYCGRDQVVWSASVNDLNTWRCDGVIFRSIYDANGEQLNRNGIGDILYAPDVAEVVAPDGMKTYYLYPNTQADGRRGMVAKSSRPDGPFTVCNWDPADPKKTLDPFERHAAGIACHYTGPAPAIQTYPTVQYSGPWMKPFYADCYDESDPYAAKVNRSSVVHVTAGSVVGYKYFNFSKSRGRKNLKLVINMIPQGVDASLEVWVKSPNAAGGGLKVGETAISASLPERPCSTAIDVAPLAELDGKAALYFVFNSGLREQSICEIEEFRFTAE